MVIYKLLVFMCVSICVIGAKEWIVLLTNKLSDNIVLLYTTCFLLSGVIADTLIASIMLPIIFISDTYKDKIKAILVAAFAIAAGSNLTYWGGGDNVLGWALTEKFLGTKISIMEWFSHFWFVVLINYIITGAILVWYYKYKKEPV